MKIYIDASFANHPDLRSHSGFIVVVGNTPLLWKSRKQKINTVNTFESEIVASTDMLPYGIRIWNYLQAQGLKIPIPKLMQDNLAVIQITEPEHQSYRSKHIGVRQISLQDLIRSKQLEVQFCPTNEMYADGLTKPLQGKLHTQSTMRLMGKDNKDDTRRDTKEVRLHSMAEQLFVS
jgi:hypothetical protein